MYSRLLRVCTILYVTAGCTWSSREHHYSSWISTTHSIAWTDLNCIHLVEFHSETVCVFSTTDILHGEFINASYLEGQVVWMYWCKVVIWYRPAQQYLSNACDGCVEYSYLLRTICYRGIDDSHVIVFMTVWHHHYMYIIIVITAILMYLHVNVEVMLSHLMWNDNTTVILYIHVSRVMPRVHWVVVKKRRKL